ncbi:hypothetical protein B0T18DRAFT_431468 [Schizothecium vesticola]|uniref:Acyl-CoA dehydrogenase/oxidase N-terminal domain-containing protein n=1 Tax=Schizothecium vesticola TaxID=314040 RepID=A0AA40EI36_9PEZI|nr:hypothetical protein B0T18DRAFT_431468 [Schizothecium vesticola]
MLASFASVPPARARSGPPASARARRPLSLMATSGFTDTQLTHDQFAKDPISFHAAVARDGWFSIILPESLGGARLGISEATIMMQTIAESGAGMAGAQSILTNVYATQPLAKFGTKEQLEETIPNINWGK